MWRRERKPANLGGLRFAPTWTHSQISGTPVRIVDDAGNVTGGMIWSREGEKAAGVNDSSYPFGWNSERFAGGAPSGGGIPFIVGAYLTALHRGIPSTLASEFPILPDVTMPTASNQPAFATRQIGELAAPIWAEVGAVNENKIPGERANVDGHPAGERCFFCCVNGEGTIGVLKELMKNAPRCPDGKQAKPVGTTWEAMTKQARAGERSCWESCEKSAGPGKTKWETKMVKPDSSHWKHCCNSPLCCYLTVECDGCQGQGSACGLGGKPDWTPLTPGAELRPEWYIPWWPPWDRQPKERQMLTGCAKCEDMFPPYGTTPASCADFCFSLSGGWRARFREACITACENACGNDPVTTCADLLRGWDAFEFCLMEHEGRRAATNFWIQACVEAGLPRDVCSELCTRPSRARPRLPNKGGLAP
jgi:hypothetical protein